MEERETKTDTYAPKFAAIDFFLMQMGEKRKQFKAIRRGVLITATVVVVGSSSSHSKHGVCTPVCVFVCAHQTRFLCSTLCTVQALVVTDMCQH